MIIKGREKISTEHLLVKHYFLQRLEGVLILAVNWGQSIRMHHLPIALGTKPTKPFKPFLREGKDLSHQGCAYNCTPVTDVLYRRALMCEPKRKVIPSLGSICLFPLQTGQYKMHLVVPKGMSWLQK